MTSTAQPALLFQCQYLPPLSGRTVVRCTGCGLVQFVSDRKHCRRCPVDFSVAPPAATSLAYQAAGTDETSAPVGIGKAVRFCRVAYGLSQREVARRMGVPRTQISKIEHGQTVMPHTALRLAAAIGIPMWLLCTLCEMRGL
jgi:DNA-binding XRE family transcriptional regulator